MGRGRLQASVGFDELLVNQQNVERPASGCVMHNHCGIIFYLVRCSLKVFPSSCPQGAKRETCSLQES